MDALPDPRMQNTAVLGRLAGLDVIPGVTGAHIEQALKQVIKPAMLDSNLAVFNAQTQPATAGESN